MTKEINQAETIRKLVVNLLRDYDKDAFSNNLVLSKIVVDNSKVKAIKYIDLKNALMNSKSYSFTEGAVVGALNTITERIDDIKKVRTKNGVFFYFSESSKDDPNKIIQMIDSEDYLDLEEQVNKINKTVSSILKNVSIGKYETEIGTDFEIKHLRNILSLSESLKNELKEHKQEKMFHDIEKMRNDVLPF